MAGLRGVQGIPVELTLYVSSDVQDTDFALKLAGVDPDGARSGSVHSAR